MTEAQEKTAGKVDNEARFNKIDRTAPAGSEHSLGAQSIRWSPRDRRQHR
jgi:hypothetical protein